MSETPKVEYEIWRNKGDFGWHRPMKRWTRVAAEQWRDADQQEHPEAVYDIRAVPFEPPPYRRNPQPTERGA